MLIVSGTFKTTRSQYDTIANGNIPIKAVPTVLNKILDNCKGFGR